MNKHKVKHHRNSDNKTGNRDHTRTTALERSVTGGLNHVLRAQPQAMFWEKNLMLTISLSQFVENLLKCILIVTLYNLKKTTTKNNNKKTKQTTITQNSNKNEPKQQKVAQRATIAHLTASHQNIMNSFQVKDFLNWSRADNSAVHGRIQSNFKLIRDYIVFLVTCKNKEDPSKNEGARELTSLLFDFSDAQGLLTPISVVDFRRNSNSSKLL